MAEVDEPYIAVLQGIINGEMVAYGDPKVISASTFIEDAKVEALQWASELHSQVGKTATMVLRKGSKTISSHTFKNE
jgi:hypothetical protein